MITEQDYQVTHEGEIYFVRLDDEGELVTVSDKDKNPADLDDDVRETVVNKAFEMYEEDEDDEDFEDEDEKEVEAE
jgi:hypothetical protein